MHVSQMAFVLREFEPKPLCFITVHRPPSTVNETYKQIHHKRRYQS